MTRTHAIRRLGIRAAWRSGPTAHVQPAAARGVSLLEVLIAMFVLLFGLMGVAAIFPVGSHYAGRSEQFDRGAALAGSALAELKARGLLRPSAWLDPTSKTIVNPATGNFELGANAGHAFVIDPLAAAETTNTSFPFRANNDENLAAWRGNPYNLSGAGWPIRRVTFGQTGGVKLSPRIAESVFRLRDDLTVELPQENDRPGIQRWNTTDVDPQSGAANNTPDYFADDTPVSRDYAGSYSWLATVVPMSKNGLAGLQPADPRYGSQLYEVSVAVVYKRESVPGTDTERMLGAELNSGGDLVVYAAGNDISQVDDALQDIRPGQWIALAGVHPASGVFQFKWYRLLSLDEETTDGVSLQAVNGVAARRAMVEGPEWPLDGNDANYPTATNLRAILLPGVTGVTTQALKLETD